MLIEIRPDELERSRQAVSRILSRQSCVPAPIVRLIPRRPVAPPPAERPPHPLDAIVYGLGYIPPEIGPVHIKSRAAFCRLHPATTWHGARCVSRYMIGPRLPIKEKRRIQALSTAEDIVLADIPQGCRNDGVFVLALAEAVSRYHRTPADVILSASLNRRAVAARHMIMFALRKGNRWSFPRIGRAMNTHHTNVMAACRNTERRIAAGKIPDPCRLVFPPWILHDNAKPKRKGRAP